MIKKDASKYADFEISEFEISRFDYILELGLVELREREREKEREREREGGSKASY